MIVQWCVKGMSLPDDATAKWLIDSGSGIICNWWRRLGAISPDQSRQVLTDVNLDRHVNHFGKPDPMTGRPFSESTPFISMSAGMVERDAVAKTNYARRARRTALWFGTDFVDWITLFFSHAGCCSLRGRRWASKASARKSATSIATAGTLLTRQRGR